MIALITGGSGSGKSAYAEKLALSQPCSERIYLATMQNWGDDETKARIARHRAMRKDKGFDTVEQPSDLQPDRIPEGACVLLEDLPNLLANEMFGGGDVNRILPALETLMARRASLIIVTDDISRDGNSYEMSTMAYLRSLDLMTAHLADRADLVAEVVCGIPIPVKGELPCV